jgi:hypothetical protein
MELAFKDWVELNEAVISYQDIVTKFPWLVSVFNLKGLPENWKNWTFGFRNGLKAKKAGWTIQDNPYITGTGQVAPQNQDFSNGWLAAFSG